ncbi:phospholipase A2 inhibitor and Ly6/PLAUR domain-containing protein-like [Lithobates pipiens]
MMTSLLHILCVLSALVASGLSLNCMHCMSTTTSCSSGVSLPCASGYTCGYTAMRAKGANLYLQSCVPQKQCDLKGSVSLPNGEKGKMATSCCGTDDCTPTLPSLPVDSSASNGLTCRSCKVENSDWCYTSDTMKCTGGENMCLLQTVKITGSQSVAHAARGCATKSICDLGSQSYNIQGMSTDIRFTCTSGSTGLPKGFYLPALICLSLLKLLI